MSKRIDHNTFASHPGGVMISVDKFLDYKRIKGFERGMYRFLLKNMDDFFFRFSELTPTLSDWYYLKGQLQFGCANPALLLDQEKKLVAVYTDLANDGGEPVDVIKIISLETNENLDDELVTISMYSPNDEDQNARAWKDFHPVYPMSLSTDDVGYRMAFEGLDRDDWELLKIGLDKIPPPYKEGLYHFSV